MPDVVDLIKAQHRLIDSLLDQAEEAEGAERIAVLRKVSDLLKPHSEAEESFVYPSIREHDSSEADEVKDGTAEHHHIEGVMEELLAEDPDGPGWDGKLAALIGELRHHVEEEEEDLLPVLSEKASDAERAELGARFAEATGSTAEETAAGATREELLAKAAEQDVPGRSEMTKEQLAEVVDRA